MKRPSFQFYPADWQANSNLKRCTFEEKGIWLEVICLLHDQEVYGVSRWTLKEIAQAVGCTFAKLKALVEKGILKGADAGAKCAPLVYVPRSGRRLGAAVTLVTEQDGPIWYSSRMVTDEHKRIARGETGETPKPAPDPSPKPPIGEDIGADIGVAPKPAPDPSPSSCAQAPRAAPSSSSSSSSSKERHKRTSAPPPFDPLPELRSRGVDDQTAADWLILRKSKRAIVTVTALDGILLEAGKAGMSLDGALKTCCTRGWAGFKAKWLTDDAAGGDAQALVAGKDWE